MKPPEFIEWLKSQDQEATIQVLEKYEGKACGEYFTATRTVDFDPDKHAELFDMRNNKFAKGKPHENSVTLLLGGDE